MSWAVAAGVTSIATTMMIPTAWMLTTIVTPSRARSRYSRRATGSPEAAAPSGSKVANSSSLRIDQDDREHDRPEDRDLDEIAEPDPEDVAEEVAEQVGDVVLDRAEEQDAERERAREQHADRRCRNGAGRARDTQPIASAVATAAIAPPM